MLNKHDSHFFREHPLHTDWPLLGVLAFSAAIISAVSLLQLTMPFLTLPAIF